MKPHVKRILAKLGKEKVELGLADDAKKEASDLIKFRDDLSEYTRTILNAQGSLSKNIDKVKSKYTPVKAIIRKYETQLKELGIDGEPTILRNIKNALSETERIVARFEKDFLS